MIYFLHIHKCGGSTFVNLATKNGEILHNPNKNGNPYGTDGKIIPFWNYSKTELEKFFSSSNFTFCSNETCLKYMHCDKSIKYVSIIRHPIDIIISCYHHQNEGTKSNISFHDFVKKKKLLERGKLSLQDYETQYFNNPLIFYFSGCSDIQIAMENAKKFDAIICLDNYKKDIRIMQEIAGWKITDVNSNRMGTRRNSNYKKDLSPDDYDYLKNQMKMDIDFYEELKSKIKNGMLM